MQKKKTTTKQESSMEEYKQDPLFKRNKEIWKYRYIENWSVKKIATHFQIPIEEVKEALTKHKVYFKEEYD